MEGCGSTYARLEIEWIPIFDVVLFVLEDGERGVRVDSNNLMRGKFFLSRFKLCP